LLFASIFVQAVLHKEFVGAKSDKLLARCISFAAGMDESTIFLPPEDFSRILRATRLFAILPPPTMRPLLSLIALAVLLAGCGYKAPLYLPKPKPGAQSTAPKPPAGQDDKKPTGDPTRQSPDPGTLNPERGADLR
jgi:predicted small lipoprotein YifL